MIPLRKQLGREFFKELDYNLRIFCREIRRELRDEKDSVIAITGYPGLGKSNAAAIIAALIDYEYDFEENICFIPTSKDIQDRYMNLPMFSVLHIDEASRGLHKQKWHDKVQQKLNQLYDTEREGHFLCTLLLMPRFQNFTENFRNFRIKYWINIVERGLAVVYKRDDDKDSRDPWHLDENYRLKEKRWKGKRVFERDIPDQIRMEQYTKNYWFYFHIPPVPSEIWKDYQMLKQKSRIEEENIPEIESYRDRIGRERRERLKKISELANQGKTLTQIAIEIGLSESSVQKYIRQIRAMVEMEGKKKG